MVKRIKKEREDFILSIDTLKGYSIIDILKENRKREKREREREEQRLEHLQIII